MYIAQVCVYVCCSSCVRVCGNVCNVAVVDISTVYCIKQEDYEIFAHTHNISIDDVRVAIKHLKNLNLIVLMVYFLVVLLMELNCYFLIFLYYLS